MKSTDKTSREPVNYICRKCAKAAGGKMRPGHLATWHAGKCGMCAMYAIVTQPRDFGLFSHGLRPVK